METFSYLQDLNINSSCRTCLENINRTQIHYDIFSTPGLQEKIFACTSLAVEPGDGFPTSLCASCFTKIDDYYNFQQTCISAKTQFLECKDVDKKPITEINAKLFTIPEIENDGNCENEAEIENDENCENEAEIENDENEDSTSTNLHAEASFSVLYQVETVLNDEVPQIQSNTNLSQDMISRSKRINFVCEICNHPFMMIKTYQAHMRLHQGLKPYPCQLCDMSYSRQTQLKAHIKSIHKKITDDTFLCTELDCNKNLKSREMLLEHLKEKHWINRKDPKKSYTCKECGLVQSNLDILLTHRSEHVVQKQKKLNELTSNQKENYCPICDKHIKKLAIHTRLVHEGVKEYPCRYCHQLFARPNTRKHHEMIHTGEKPHQCQKCLKSFIQITSFKNHKCPNDTKINK